MRRWKEGLRGATGDRGRANGPYTTARSRRFRRWEERLRVRVGGGQQSGWRIEYNTEGSLPDGDRAHNSITGGPNIKINAAQHVNNPEPLLRTKLET